LDAKSNFDFDSKIIYFIYKEILHRAFNNPRGDVAFFVHKLCPVPLVNIKKNLIFQILGQIQVYFKQTNRKR